jgi:hypothetical protein
MRTYDKLIAAIQARRGRGDLRPASGVSTAVAARAWVSAAPLPRQAGG